MNAISLAQRILDEQGFIVIAANVMPAMGAVVHGAFALGEYLDSDLVVIGPATCADFASQLGRYFAEAPGLDELSVSFSVFYKVVAE